MNMSFLVLFLITSESGGEVDGMHLQYKYNQWNDQLSEVELNVQNIPRKSLNKIYLAWK